MQAADVHGVDRHVGADCGVGGGPQFRLVFYPGSCHTAGEINQRLLLVYMLQLLSDCAQCFQTAVSVEDVEFGVIGSERAAGIGCAFGRSCGSFLKSLTVAGVEGLQDFFQLGAVRREVLIYV